MQYKDLTGEVFGMLTVVKSTGKNKWGNKLWECQCSCGNFTTIITGNLTGKKPIKSCGCLNHRKVPMNDLKGQRFGRLIAIEYTLTSQWKCVCDCGKEVIVGARDLKSGNTKSCGCLRKDMMTTHGLSTHTLLKTRKDILRRCYNKKCDAFKYYGARGITVCSEWKVSFISFYNWAIANGWKEGLTIDRKDNDGNYSPENCEFVTKSKNCKKTRLIRSSNTSGYRGVSLYKNTGKFQAYYQYNKKFVWLGTFLTAKQAAKVRDLEIIEKGIDLPLNFPELKKEHI